MFICFSDEHFFPFILTVFIFCLFLLLKSVFQKVHFQFFDFFAILQLKRENAETRFYILKEQIISFDADGKRSCAFQQHAEQVVAARNQPSLIRFF